MSDQENNENNNSQNNQDQEQKEENQEQVKDNSQVQNEQNQSNNEQQQSQNIENEQQENKEGDQNNSQEKNEINQEENDENKEQQQENQATEQEQQKIQEKQEQQPQITLRKVAEKAEIPVEKDDLIKFLVERLQKTEDAITDTQALVLQERQNKIQLQKQLEEKDKLLMDLLHKEDLTIEGKVKNELKITLDEAMKDKIQAEQMNQELQQKLFEKNQELLDTSNYLNQLKTDFRFSKSEIERLNIENNDSLNLIKNLQKENMQIRNESKTWNDQMEKLKQELRDSQQIVTKLQDVKTFLNKVNVDSIGNQHRQQQEQYNTGQSSNYQHSPSKHKSDYNENFWYSKK